MGKGRGKQKKGDGERKEWGNGTFECEREEREKGERESD